MKKKSTIATDSIPTCKSVSYPNVLKGIISLFMLVAVIATGCKKDDYKGEIKGDCPVVVATDPTDKAVDVVLNKVISATFNTTMAPSTINDKTFTIKQGATVITGKVAPTADSKIFTFTPDQPLLPFTTYTGTITTGATDTLRTAMVSDYVWSFTTIPQITVSSTPAAGGLSAGAGTFAQGSTVNVTATPNTGYTFTNWTDNGTVVSTSSSYQFSMAGNKALVANFKVIPPSQFAVVLSSLPVAGGTTSGSGAYNAGTLVTVTAFPSAGYTFVNWTDNGAVASTSSSYQFNIAGNRTLVANFKLIPASQFAVTLSSSPAAGGSTNGSGAYNAGSSVTVTATPHTGYNFVSWTDNGTIVSVTPSYQFILIANRTLVANFTLTPVTPPGVGIGPGAIDLGLAGNFTILTKSGISTTGITSVTGDIGVSPAAATAITGFGLIMDANGQASHTPIVTGKVYASDYSAPTPSNMTTAVNDMQTAYTTANNLVVPAPIVDLFAGDISGKILPAGLYKWGTGVLITNQGVTLTGGANDTWVFQIAQNLTVNNNAKITLLGGAQAKNIFWIVAGQATLGTGVDFSGIILSKTLISLNTGAKVTGKLLAQTAVTLNASTVTP
jgi:uncharacterized repeat protein (TIGR02543 family)